MQAAKIAPALAERMVLSKTALVHRIVSKNSFGRIPEMPSLDYGSFDAHEAGRGIVAERESILLDGRQLLGVDDKAALYLDAIVLERVRSGRDVVARVQHAIECFGLKADICIDKEQMRVRSVEEPLYAIVSAPSDQAADRKNDVGHWLQFDETSHVIRAQHRAIAWRCDQGLIVSLICPPAGRPSRDRRACAPPARRIRA